MANREQIIKTILEVAGNPVVGDVRDFVELWADAIIALDNPAKETRVLEAKETR